ncbi:unnamed protein product [Pseudo-nitzschia multistriata]|uniref:Protease Do-like PDZ domain-containing protein n=1 Tax=Pseudo-nitzschia multistriata TaxID=183589 RepID=A0A448YWF9_9STRA|nr:unnamed protein product [Pseudo-nitzschia multistriata]
MPESTPKNPRPATPARGKSDSASDAPVHDLHRRSRQATLTRMRSSPPQSPPDAAAGSNHHGDGMAPSLFWPSNSNPTKKPAASVPGEETPVDAEYCNNEGEEYDDYDEGSYYHDCDYYDEVFDSIVKIYATHNFEPDTTMPWQKQKSYNSYSSGFAINGRRILTNAHSVEYAGQVLVRRRGSSRKYRATVEVVANECDLAVLTIADETFWTTRTEYDEDEDDEYDDYEEDEEEEDGGSEKGAVAEASPGDDAIKPLSFGALPELQDEVEVLGYPTGGDSLSVTKGVVSRIEATEYAQCSGSHLLAIQIDAAINGGNSGGPVVDAATGRVVGVAFQALEHAENIGYVVPVTVVLHFLEGLQRHGGTYSGVTCLGVRYSRLENESMRRYLKLPDAVETAKPNGGKKKSRRKKSSNSHAQGGVVVRSCYPTCPSRNVLRESDVILSIDGIPVASDGNVPFRRNGRERVSFSSYVQTKFSGDTVALDLWRDGGSLKVDVPLAVSRDLVPPHWNNQSPPYFIVGGLVFTALSIPYLEDCGAWGEYVSDSLSYLMNKVYEPLEKPGDQVVVLINVLAHPANTGYDGLTNLHLRSVNGAPVRSLRHLKELIEAEQQGTHPGASPNGTDSKDTRDTEPRFLRLGFGSKTNEGDGGILVVLETDSIEDINREVCEEHSIQHPFYFPPLASNESSESQS